jgi:hypothetical protein
VDLEVYRPQEHLCPPRLREAATTLNAMADSVSVQRNIFVSKKNVYLYH